MKICLLILVLFTAFAVSQTLGQQVFGHKFQKVYYVGNCGEIYNISQSAYVDFKDEKDAIDKGFKKAETCTILEKPKEEKPIEFYGDSVKKIYYHASCNEIWQIPDKTLMRFETKDEAIKGGYKEGKCTLIKKIESAPSSSKRKPIYPTSLYTVETKPDEFYGNYFYVRGRVNKIDTICSTLAGGLAAYHLYKISDSSITSRYRTFVLMVDSDHKEDFEDRLIKTKGWDAQDFEIRITAGSISAFTRRLIPLTVSR